MSIGGSIFLLAVGAILRFAVTAEVADVDIRTVGLILMIAGALGLIISLALLMQANSRRAAAPPDDRRPPDPPAAY